MSVTDYFLQNNTLRMYLGTNAEKTALSTTGIAVGSKFYESDTHLEFVYSGNAWVAWELHTIAE